MSEIADLERRITSALERIGRGLDSLPAAGVAPAEAPAGDPEAVAALAAAQEEIAGLQNELAAERETSAQLNERLRAVKERQDGSVADQERRLAEMAEMDEILGGLEPLIGRVALNGASEGESTDA